MLNWIMGFLFPKKKPTTPAPPPFWREADSGQPIKREPARQLSEEEMKRLFPNLTPVNGVIPAMPDPAPAPAPRPMYNPTPKVRAYGGARGGDKSYARTRQDDERRTTSGSYSNDMIDPLSPMNPNSVFYSPEPAPSYSPPPSYDPPACSPPPDSGISGGIDSSGW